MKHTDKLATLFDKIETSINQRKCSTELNYLKYYEEIIKTLINEGIIKTYIVNKGILTLFFYSNATISEGYVIEITRISKPGKRVYITSKEIFNLNNYHNTIYLLSTSSGIMSNNKALLLASQNKEIGGELLCKITHHVNRTI